MITVSRGDWRNPVYARESKEAFYASVRRPLGNTAGDDPTTIDLKDEEMRVALLKSDDLLKVIMKNEVEPTPGILRVIWQWGVGYIFHQRLNDPRIAAVVSTGIIEFTSDPVQFEIIRQEMLGIQEQADELADGVLRADSRRSMVEYLNMRTFYRVSGYGTNPVARFEGDALATLAAGGSWTGTTYELVVQMFPEMQSMYTSLPMLEKFVALGNAIASLPRDQRAASANALIPVYIDLGVDFTRDLALICEYMDVADGRELSLAAHFVATNNIHSRYIMLAVFLASLRLGGVSIVKSRVYQVWKTKSLAYAERMVMPGGCLITSREDREKRILAAVHRLWVPIEATERDRSDDAIAQAQRALHRFIDEEMQWVSWQKADPAVLWAVCAAMFWALSRVDGMASLMMRGDEFKSLYVESEGFDLVWLHEIFDARDSGSLGAEKRKE